MEARIVGTQASQGGVFLVRRTNLTRAQYE
jgi:hypothetical protein